MAGRGRGVHVVTTRREYKGRVYEAHLLRRSYREGGKVKNETLANLSRLPRETIELVRRSLRDNSTHATFTKTTRPNRTQTHALQLLGLDPTRL